MEYKLINKAQKKYVRFLKKRYSIFISDAKNKIIHGRIAPLYAEKIWVEPSKCKLALFNKTRSSGLIGIRISGQVIDFWPPKKTNVIVPVLEIPKIKFCIDHWGRNIPWEKTGVYEYMEKRINNSKNKRYNMCKNMNDVIKRYQKLDEIFNQIKSERRIRSVRETNPKAFREEDGILIHLGPEGEFFLGGSFHRFAMALILELAVIPAQIGYVHKSALPYLPSLRGFK